MSETHLAERLMYPLEAGWQNDPEKVAALKEIWPTVIATNKKLINAEITTLRAQLEEARAKIAQMEATLLDRDADRTISAELMESIAHASRYSEPITLDCSAAADIWGETVRSRGKIFHLGRKVEEARAKAIEECAQVAENCDTLGPSYQDHELTPEGMYARKKVRQITESIRALLHGSTK